MSKQLYVGKLPRTTTESERRTLFERYPQVDRALRANQASDRTAIGCGRSQRL